MKQWLSEFDGEDWSYVGLAVFVLVFAVSLGWLIQSGAQERLSKAQELVQKHCAATDIGETAVIYTCDGGKHLVREVN